MIRKSFAYSQYGISARRARGDFSHAVSARNDFPLVVAVHYNRRLIFIRFVGTPQQHDRINAEDI